MDSTLPAQLEVRPILPFEVSLRVPGSKSLTNRALLLAALADGTSRLTGVLFSDDSRRMLEALQQLGFDLAIDEERHAVTVTVTGKGGHIPGGEADLHLGNAGTAYRFLTAACCLGDGLYTLDGIPRMRQRPIGELVDALREIGGQIEYLGEIGFPPLRIRGEQLAGGQIDMEPTLSSQYISALLQIAPFCQNGLTIHFHGPVTSQPYVDMTLRLMAQFGATTHADESFSRVRVDAGRYKAFDYDIEPDASNASYFLAAAAVVPASVCTIEGLGRKSLQGDVGFAEVLGQMGARVEMGDHQITVASPRQGLRGVDVDLNEMPDMAQTLAAVAVFAEGPTTIRNVGNLRVKETDRMAALQNELTKLGATVLIHGDDLQIVPPAGGRIQPAAIDTYDDHRMAMSFAIIGLRAKGVVINDPACVGKTFPDYFDYLRRLTPGKEGNR